MVRPPPQRLPFFPPLSPFKEHARSIVSFFLSLSLSYPTTCLPRILRRASTSSTTCVRGSW
jgi:hypothetical protein